MQHHRVAPLQNLRVCDSGVGHVGVDPTPTLPPWPGPRTPRNCLIVCDVVVTKGEVVHATLQTAQRHGHYSERYDDQCLESTMTFVLAATPA